MGALLLHPIAERCGGDRMVWRGNFWSDKDGSVREILESQRRDNISKRRLAWRRKA